jgi:hypothetical protein
LGDIETRFGLQLSTGMTPSLERHLKQKMPPQTVDTDRLLPRTAKSGTRAPVRRRT